MTKNVSLTNERFNFLHYNSDFLNLVLNNINSCILLLDKDLNLHDFNDALNNIFSNKKDENLQYRKCGEAIGCAYQIEEQKECGKTSHCNTCDLKIAVLTSYMNDEVIYKEHVIKPFLNYENEKEDKHLQFSTRMFVHNREKYVIMIVEDITKFYETKS